MNFEQAYEYLDTLPYTYLKCREVGTDDEIINITFLIDIQDWFHITIFNDGTFGIYDMKHEPIGSQEIPLENLGEMLTLLTWDEM